LKEKPEPNSVPERCTKMIVQAIRNSTWFVVENLCVFVLFIGKRVFLRTYVLASVPAVQKKGKGKGLPRTGHEGPEGDRGIGLLFL
jgi:hypothetical protein